MLYAEFLAKVRVRGEYPGQKEAEYASRTVLALLGTQLDQDRVRGVARSVPEQVAETLRASSVASSAVPPKQDRGGWVAVAESSARRCAGSRFADHGATPAS